MLIFDNARAAAFLNRAADPASSANERLTAINVLARMHACANTSMLLGDHIFGKAGLGIEHRADQSRLDMMQATLEAYRSTLSSKNGSLKKVIAAHRLELDTLRNEHKQAIGSCEAATRAATARLAAQNAQIDSLMDQSASDQALREEMSAVLNELHDRFLSEREAAKSAQVIIAQLNGENISLKTRIAELEALPFQKARENSNEMGPTIDMAPRNDFATSTLAEESPPTVGPPCRRVHWNFPEHQRLRNIVTHGLSRGAIALKLTKEFGRQISVACVDRKVRFLNLVIHRPFDFGHWCGARTAA